MSANYQLLHVIKQCEQILVESKVYRVAGNTACVEEVPQLLLGLWQSSAVWTVAALVSSFPQANKGQSVCTESEAGKS